MLNLVDKKLCFTKDIYHEHYQQCYEYSIDCLAAAFVRSCPCTYLNTPPSRHCVKITSKQSLRATYSEADAHKRGFTHFEGIRLTIFRSCPPLVENFEVLKFILV